MMYGRLVLMAFVGVLAATSLRTVAEEAAAPAPEGKVVVYYLHHTFRCYSCNSIEALTKAALLGGKAENTKTETTVEVQPVFGEMVKSGVMTFVPLNVDKEENKELFHAFGDVSKIPVVAYYVDGKLVRHASMPEVWSLLQDNKAFVTYIQTHVQGFIDGVKKASE